MKNKDIKACIHDFIRYQTDIEYYVLPENELLLFNAFTSFSILRAAGGVVYNKAGDALVMLRFNHYDFPRDIWKRVKAPTNSYTGSE